MCTFPYLAAPSALTSVSNKEGAPHTHAYGRGRRGEECSCPGFTFREIIREGEAERKRGRPAVAFVRKAAGRGRPAAAAA